MGIQRTFPSATVTVKGVNRVKSDPNKKRIGIQIKTSIGALGRPDVLVCNDYENDFRNKCGPELTNDIGWLYAKILLSRGNVELHISSPGHLSSGAYAGTKATATKTVTAVAETAATGSTITFATVPTTDGTVQVTVFRPGQPQYSFPAVPFTAGTPLATIATTVAAFITSSVQPVTATASGAVVTLVPPAGIGTTPTTWVVSASLTGLASTTATVVQFSGGVAGTVGGTAVWTAKGPQTGYNGTIITVSPPASKTPGVVDIAITVPGTATAILTDVAQTLTADAQTALNNGMFHITVDATTTGGGNLPLGTVVLAGGNFDHTTVVAADLIGTAAGNTGWWSFKGVDIDYFGNVNFADPTVDRELFNLCLTRWGGATSARFFIRTPLNLSKAAVKQYRLGQGTYAGAPFDTYIGSGLCSTTYVYTNPVTKTDINISNIAHVMLTRVTTDIKGGEWLAAAGVGDGSDVKFGFGTVDDTAVKSVVDNWYDPADDTANGELYAYGCTVTIDHPTYGLTHWGDRSLLFDQDDMLHFDNIANYALYLCRTFQPVLEKKTFKSNQPKSWRQIYEDAKLLIAPLEDGKNGFDPAIEKGEGDGWRWIGDQLLTSLGELSNETYNKPANIKKGRYNVKFASQPFGAIEFLEMEAAVYDSQSYKIDFGTPNN